MDREVRDLASALGGILAVCCGVTLLVTLVLWLTGRDGMPVNRHENAVIVLAVLGLTELVLAWGLVRFADSSRNRAP
jgi:hypothetical protein